MTQFTTQSNIKLDKILEVVNSHNGTITHIEGKNIVFSFPSGDHKLNCRKEMLQMNLTGFALMKMERGTELGLMFNVG